MVVELPCSLPDTVIIGTNGIRYMNFLEGFGNFDVNSSIGSGARRRFETSHFGPEVLIKVMPHITNRKKVRAWDT